MDELYLEVLRVYTRLFGRQGSQEPWIVAVSGGIDSMVLLHLARRVQSQFGGQCIAAHVHHGLRAAATDDEGFVRDWCTTWGIPLEVARLSPAANAGAGNVEAAARAGRYAALAAIARSSGAKFVWIGHHADDQLETMLWRLARGTSTSGMAGMRVHVERGDCQWLRPLLSQARADIVRYAEHHQLPFVEDETNQDTLYTRNRIRHQVVPSLRVGHPRAAEHAAQLAEILQAEDDWLDVCARDLLMRTSHRNGDNFFIRVSAFRDGPLPLQRRAIKILLYCFAAGDWTNRHIEAVVQLAHTVAPSAQVQLALGVAAQRDYDTLWVGRPPAAVPTAVHLPWQFEAAETVTGVEDGAAEWTFSRIPWSAGANLESLTRWDAYVGEIEAVILRPAARGERVAPLGMKGTKKVQDVFTDAKVPRQLRWNWPIMADEAGTLIWIPGVLRSRHYLSSPERTGGWLIRAQRRVCRHGFAQGTHSLE